MKLIKPDFIETLDNNYSLYNNINTSTLEQIDMDNKSEKINFLRYYLQRKRDKAIRKKYRETRDWILQNIRNKNLNRFKKEYPEFNALNTQ